MASEGAAEVGPAWRVGQRPGFEWASGGADLQGHYLTTETHRTGTGKRRSFASSLPSPKVLAKVMWGNHAAFSALLLRSADWEPTLRATCCRPTSLPAEQNRALPTHSHLGELERNCFIYLLLQRCPAHLSEPRASGR